VKLSRLEITATVADDSPSATKEAKETNPANTFRQSVTEHCGASAHKSHWAGDEYHLYQSGDKADALQAQTSNRTTAIFQTRTFKPYPERPIIN